MRPIRKGPEPPSLTRYRAQGDSTFDGYPGKADLQDSLVREQRGICCYCGGPIRADWGAMKVEHWRAQSAFPAEQLSYRNLLGACMGGERQARKRQHCDTYKGNAELSRNPADPAHWAGIEVYFTAQGEIRSGFEPLNSELDTVLNLNLAELKNQRKAVLDGFQLANAKRGAFPRSQLERWLGEWDGHDHGDELRPYCQIVVHWLRKKLARERTID